MDDPVDQMSERVFQMVLGGLETLSVALGDRLGLYRALDGRELSSEQLAAEAGADERWVREWLEQQAVMGFLTAREYDGVRAFGLAPGTAETLARPEALTTLAPLARMTAAAAAQLDGIEAGARSGAGLPWPAYGAEMREAQAAINKPALLELLAATWLPAALPDLHTRLRSGEALRLADIGCGGGWSAIGLARAYPSLRVDGYDVDPETVSLARANVSAHGLEDRVSIVDTDLAERTGDTTYDAALAVECIHDMPDPVGVMAGVRRLLAPGAPLLVVDERVADAFAADGDDVERLMYAYSTLICLPDSMSTPGSVRTGTVMRTSTLERYAREAGFSRVTVADVEHDVFRFYVVHTD